MSKKGGARKADGKDSLAANATAAGTAAGAAGKADAAAAATNGGSGSTWNPALTRVFTSHEFDALPDLAELMADRAAKVQQQLQHLHSNLQAAQTTAASLALDAKTAATKPAAAGTATAATATAAAPAASTTTEPATGGGAAASAATNAVLATSHVGEHRCRLFDIPALLVDPRWLGTDRVRVELADPDPDRAKLAAMVFRRALVNIKADIAPTRDGAALVISGIKFEKKVDATPILKLLDYALWCEPNKLESMPAAEPRTVVVDDYRSFEFTINRELGQCGVDAKLVLNTLKHVQQSYLANAAVAAAVTPAAGAAADKDAKGDGKAVVPADALGNTATAAGGGAASATPKAPTNIRGNECFARIEKKRAALLALRSTALKDIGRIVCCKACERILEVYTKPPDPMNGLVLAELKKQIAELEVKIAEAHGIDNKQKRKRLQRKLKELQERAKFL